MNTTLSPEFIIKANNLILGLDIKTQEEYFSVSSKLPPNGFQRTPGQNPYITLYGIGKETTGSRQRGEFVETLEAELGIQKSPLLWFDNNAYNGLSGPKEQYPSQPIIILKAISDADFLKLLPRLEEQSDQFQNWTRQIILATNADMIVDKLDLTALSSDLLEFRHKIENLADSSEKDKGWSELFSSTKYRELSDLGAQLKSYVTVENLLDHLNEPSPEKEEAYDNIRNQITQAWPLLKAKLINPKPPGILLAADSKGDVCTPRS